MRAWGFVSRFSHQAGGFASPAFDATTTQRSASSMYSRGVIRWRPVRRPTFVSSSIPMPKKLAPMAPFVFR
jgi:hypothetical protein